MAKISAVCVSEKKGTRKKDAGRGLLVAGRGLEGDAHAGEWHRQVSLLAVESVDKMRAKGLQVGPGDFGENLTTQGLDLTSLPIGTLLAIRPGVAAAPDTLGAAAPDTAGAATPDTAGAATPGGGPLGAPAAPAPPVPSAGPLLELTQIGKECHTRCAIYYQAGDCVMPREGVFARVLRGGPVAAGDSLEVLAGAFRVAVLTASDKGSKGLRQDDSAEAIRGIVEGELGWPVVDYAILPDERERIAARLSAWADEGRADLVLTTGGTGFSPRDVTPEATLDVADRLVPGLAEAMRAAGLAKTPRAMLSRQVAVIRRQTLVVNLPGSPKGVRESLAAIKPALGHGLEIMTGRAGECGEKEGQMPR